MGNGLSVNPSNNNMTPNIAPAFIYQNITPNACATNCNNNKCTAMRFVTNNGPYVAPGSNGTITTDSEFGLDITTNLKSCSIYTNSGPIGLIPYNGQPNTGSTMATLNLICGPGLTVSSSNNSCVPCPAGFSCPNGSLAAPVSCNTNTWPGFLSNNYSLFGQTSCSQATGNYAPSYNNGTPIFVSSVTTGTVTSISTNGSTIVNNPFQGQALPIVGPSGTAGTGVLQANAYVPGGSPTGIVDCTKYNYTVAYTNTSGQPATETFAFTPQSVSWTTPVSGNAVCGTNGEPTNVCVVM